MTIVLRDQALHSKESTANIEVIERSSISWRAVFAGMFIALLSYLILTSLGLAIGGGALQGIIEQREGAGPIGIGSGIWLVVSTLVSLFIGGYAAGRVGGLIQTRIGSVQGAVIAALFFAVMFSQLGSVIGGLGRGLGSTVGAVKDSVTDLSKNPRVQSVVEDSLGGLELQSPPEVVAQGLASRLVRGDTTGARNYLARQAGVSPAEADAKIGGLMNNFQNTLRDIGTTTAKVLSVLGWTLFGSLLLGTLASMTGGGIGVRRNLREPISHRDEEVISKDRVA